MIKENFKISVFLFLFLIVNCFAQEKTTVKKVFLLAGQSNMDGRADADQISDADLKRLDAVKDRIQFYYNGKKGVPLQISLAEKHIQKRYNLKHFFGPEIFFGIELAEKYPNEEFIFIKKSRGGMSLQGAWNPNWSEEKAKSMGELDQPKLYSEFVAYAHKILDSMEQTDYTISGMLWVQGEADSSKKRGPEPGLAYEDNLTKLIRSVRDEFHVNEMPFILFQVGYRDVVVGMKNVAKSDKYVSLIPQSDNKNSKDYYPKNPPPIGHYIADSMKRIGENFFKTYEEVYAGAYFND